MECCHRIVSCRSGNHDDPSRDGIGDPLSALDFFSAANLVNYIGKHEQVEDIEITPILIRKGKTTIAIYPLGAIRDERLVRRLIQCIHVFQFVMLTNCAVVWWYPRSTESHVDKQKSQIP